jgi:hypothetical protein
MIINPYAFASKLVLQLNFGDNTSTGTATDWHNLYAEPNPDEASGTIDSSRGSAWSSYGNIGGSGVSIRALNGANTNVRWGIFAGASAGALGETSGIYPSAVMQNYWFGNASNPTLEIYGLDDSKTYKITLLGSRSNSGGATGPRPTTYVVDGQTLTALECFQNTTNTRIATGCTPSSGVISVQLVLSTSSFTYLNAMIIEEE